MDNVAAPTCLPAEIQGRLNRFLPSLPCDWRVSSVQPKGQDWLVNLADAEGAAVSQIVLLGERSAEAAHGAQPRR
jgi:hypothetical protein